MVVGKAGVSCTFLRFLPGKKTKHDGKRAAGVSSLPRALFSASEEGEFESLFILGPVELPVSQFCWRLWLKKNYDETDMTSGTMRRITKEFRSHCSIARTAPALSSKYFEFEFGIGMLEKPLALYPCWWVDRRATIYAQLPALKKPGLTGYALLALRAQE